MLLRANWALFFVVCSVAAACGPPTKTGDSQDMTQDPTQDPTQDTSQNPTKDMTPSSTGRQLLFTVQPAASAVAGETFAAFSVGLYDDQGMPIADATDEITLSADGDVLLGTITLNATAGNAVFSLVHIDRAGTYTLHASAGSLTADSTVAVTIVAAAPSKLSFTTAPPPMAMAGVSLDAFTVGVFDAFDNPVSTATDSIALSTDATPAPGALFGTTASSATAGEASFTAVNLHAAGTYMLHATSGSLTPADSAAIVVLAAEPSQLLFTVEPPSTSTVAGVALASFSVGVFDAFGNRCETATDMITLSTDASPAPGALLGTTVAPANGTSGEATFSAVSIGAIGSYAIHASSGTLTPADSASAVSIVVGSPDHLVFTVQPPVASTAAGASLTPFTVAVVDQGGNVILDATSTITLTTDASPAPGALLGTTVASANGTTGEATFSAVNLRVAGSYTVHATSPGLAPVDSAAPIVIVATGASKLAFISQPSDAVAGVSLAAFNVGVFDPFDNLVGSAADTITLSTDASPAPGALFGTSTASASSGVAAFAAVNLHTAGSYTVRADASGLASATSSPINITPDIANKLAFTVQPPTTSTTAGTNLAAFNVGVFDQFDNHINGATDAIVLSTDASPAPGALLGTTTAGANGTSGEATFALVRINVAGSYTIHASSGTLTPADSAAPSPIGVGIANKLLFAVEPPTATTDAGVSLTTFKVSVTDAVGNVVTGATNTITLSTDLLPAPGALFGTTSAAAVAGVATFSAVNLHVAGS